MNMASLLRIRALVLGILATSVCGCMEDAVPVRAEAQPRTSARNVDGTPIPVAGDTAAAHLSATSVSGGSLLLSNLMGLEDAPSHGGTLTFQGMGAPGWYPSRRDPAVGMCDAYKSGQCCMAKHTLPDAGISPWDEELILTLRGPMLVRQFAVYQPKAADAASWDRVSYWDDKTAPQGVGFQGDAAPGGVFGGSIGNKCLIDVSTDRKFACGPGSVPYCPENSPSHLYGWDGSKLILLLAAMPHFGDAALTGVKNCSEDKADNWFDAPWIGLSHGELVRAGKFGGCNCYSKDPAHWELADGCGQFNVFETVNDNNSFRNLDLFSTNFFGYQGYVGEGPCGTKCDAAKPAAAVDLIDKANSGEASPGIASPKQGAGAAFRRPAAGFRWFVILMDSKTRTVQLALVHPGNLPGAMATLAVTPPAQVGRASIDALLALRLPAPPSTSIYRE